MYRLFNTNERIQKNYKVRKIYSPEKIDIVFIYIRISVLSEPFCP